LANYGKFPIYRYPPNRAPEGFQWVRVGILGKLYKNSELPNAKEYKEMVLSTLKKYRFKAETTKLFYRQLITDHIDGVYLNTYFNIAKDLYDKDFYQEAKDLLTATIIIDKNFADGYLNLGIILAKEKKCQQAEDNFNQVLRLKKDEYLALINLESLYRDCWKDDKKADEFKERARIAKEEKEKPLETF